MFLMIMVGYIYFAFYGLIMIMFVLMKVRRFKARRRSRQNDEQMLQHLPRVMFSEEMFGALSDDNECIICMTPFKVEDTITALGCKHFYHTKCIESWIQKGSQFCPMCRHQIITQRPHSLSISREPSHSHI